MANNDRAGISGSRASTEPCGLGPAGFDPGRKLDAWLDEPGQCRPCHGPIVAKTKLGMIRDYVCYVAALHWPDRFFMSAPHAALLPYAGNHAFTCTCWPKIADMTTRSHTPDPQGAGPGQLGSEL